jgi:hypothetical protein
MTDPSKLYTSGKMSQSVLITGTEYLAVKWTPRPDITTHELALLLPVVVSASFSGLSRSAYDLLGSERRHLTILGKIDPWTGQIDPSESQSPS